MCLAMQSITGGPPGLPYPDDMALELSGQLQVGPFSDCFKFSLIPPGLQGYVPGQSSASTDGLMALFY